MVLCFDLKQIQSCGYPQHFFRLELAQGNCLNSLPLAPYASQQLPLPTILPVLLFLLSLLPFFLFSLPYQRFLLFFPSFFLFSLFLFSLPRTDITLDDSSIQGRHQGVDSPFPPRLHVNTCPLYTYPPLYLCSDGTSIYTCSSLGPSICQDGNSPLHS